MPTLTLTKNYEDATVLFESDFDDFLDEIEAFLNSTKINGDNIQADGITASLKIADSSITTAKIADANITTAKIADSAVTTAKIVDANITTAKIADSAVTTAKIVDANVTTAKIAATSITKDKLAGANYVLSSSCGAYTGSSSVTDITNLSCTITTNGRPVEIRLVSDGSGNACYVSKEINTGTPSSGGYFNVVKDGSNLVTLWNMTPRRYSFSGAPAASYVIPTGALYIDTPAAGTYTYKIQTQGVMTTAYLKLLVREL